MTVPPSVPMSALLSPSVQVTEMGTNEEVQSSVPELMGENRTCIMLHMDVRGLKAGRFERESQHTVLSSSRSGMSACLAVSL